MKTPFEEWWPCVQPSFPTVPENAARHWLHRHWGHSPYCYLASTNYTFVRLIWSNLREIRTLWSEYRIENAGALQKGEELVTSSPHMRSYVSEYMLEHRRFPAPIVILDNRDGHHNRDYPDQIALPDSLILMEGHLRFNVGLYLDSIGKLDRADVWLMIKKS